MLAFVGCPAENARGPLSVLLAGLGTAVGGPASQDADTEKVSESSA